MRQDIEEAQWWRFMWHINRCLVAKWMKFNPPIVRTLDHRLLALEQYRHGRYCHVEEPSA